MKLIGDFSRGKIMRVGVAVCLFSLIVPLIVGVLWGPYFNDHTYATFHSVRDWVIGREWSQTGELPLDTPLYLLALTFWAKLGISLPYAALIFSMLGWGVVAIAICHAGIVTNHPIVAVIGTVLVVTDPLIIATLGTEVSWTVAWAWIAIVALLQKRWRAQTVAMVLMLYTHFDVCTLILAVLLLIIQGFVRREFPLWPSLILAVVGLGLGAVLVWHFAYPVTYFWVGLVSGPPNSQQFPNGGDLQWLFFLFACMGLLTFLAANWQYSAIRRIVIAGLAWVVFSILSGSTVVQVMMVTLVSGFVGFGIEYMLQWLETRNTITNYLALTFLVGLPLVIAQVSPLVWLYHHRPVNYQLLERQAGDWLRAHSETTATVFASERVGYFASRPTQVWNGSPSDPASLIVLLQMLSASPPAYCVSFKSLAWDYIRQTSWFQENYTPVQQFASPYDIASPLTVWRYRFRVFDTETRSLLNMHLPRDVDLVGYQYTPSRIEPGDAVYVTLFLRATQPFTEAFRTVVELFSPNEGIGWAQNAAFITHPSLLTAWWQTDSIVPTRLVLTTTADIPIGAYHLRMFITEAESQQAVPFFTTFDESPVQDITLGYVVVPWQGTLDTAQRVDANLGNQIRLLGFEPLGDLSPGEELEVVLYWETHQPPEEDYIVFVHLLNENGQLVANHDGMPSDGRYPTKTWLPGDVVLDKHRVVLDSDIPTGTYRLQVGIYRWPSLERLPVWDQQGVEQPDHVVVLQTIEVR